MKKIIKYGIGIILLLVLLISTNMYTRYSTVKNKNVEFKKAEEKRSVDKKDAEEKEKVDRMKTIQSKSSFKINVSDLAKIDNVILVAHPDDEVLWGGNHLLNGNYLVVCMTNGNNKTRVNEFHKTMKKTGDVGVMLKYPDLVGEIRSDWGKDKEKMINDIKYILNLKKWKTIVTHNPEGEYGHIQHKMLSYLVTNECIKEGLTENLQYFERYYKRNEIRLYGIMPTLTPKQINKKRNVIMDDYKSRAAVKMFEHMIPYEQFVKYKDWTFTPS